MKVNAGTNGSKNGGECHRCKELMKIIQNNQSGQIIDMKTFKCSSSGGIKSKN